GVAPRRAAVLLTTGLRSTGLASPRGQPSGQKGTNAIPRLRHSCRTGAALRSARWNMFCTQTTSVPAAACRSCPELTLLSPTPRDQALVARRHQGGHLVIEACVDAAVT